MRQASKYGKSIAQCPRAASGHTFTHRGFESAITPGLPTWLHRRFNQDDIKRIYSMCHIRELPTTNQKRKIMNIKELYDKVSQGAPFYVNFKERTIRVGKKLYRPEDIEDFTDFGALSDMSEKDMLDVLVLEYNTYKHSVPSERSDNHKKSYFKALPYKELSDDDILYGAPREFSRCVLEVSFLRAVLSGKLKWNNEWGSWFWQSPDDKDFVILREWVDPKKD